jgi:hypothetical protein
MKFNLRRAISSAAVLAIAGGVIASAGVAANAATTPPWEPDPNALGSLTFYNSAGQVVTGGNNLAHLFDYAKASTADTTGGTKAVIYFAQPQLGVATLNWFSSQASTATNFPNTAAPAPLNTSTTPVSTLAAADVNLTNFIASTVPQTATGYANVTQVRLYTTGAGSVGTLGAGTYWEADILVNPTAGTWSVEYPAVVTATTTTLGANPNPVTQGTATTLTATEAPAAAGSVAFMNGTTTIATVPVNASGVATTSYTPTAAGTQSLSAVFTPTDPTSFGGSTGTASLTVNPPATPTTTSLTVTQNGSTGSAIGLSSTVTPAAAAGTVSWYDNGSTTPLNATPVTPTGGVATFSIAAGLAAGAHSIVAVFSPTSVTQFQVSQSAAQQFILQAPLVGACANAGSQCTDVQNIEATIPVGTLVLTSPYTAASPLNLGNLALAVGAQSQYSATAAFNGITVVDTRAGDLPWTLTALASNLTDGKANPGSTICGQNVGLTAVTSTPGTGFAGTVTPTANAAATPAVAPAGGACTGTQGLGGTTPHTVAAASAGLGTDVLNGTLTLTAPVSTEPGLFQGTITLTVG